MAKLTAREVQVMAAIRASLKRLRYSPSVRELMLMTGLRSPAAVQYHIDALRAKGLLTEAHGKARTLRPT